MYQVGFPGVIESFKRAFHEVLAGYFTGEPSVLMADNVQLYACDILFGNDFLTGEPRQNPFIAIVGSRAGSRKTEKCIDTKNHMPHGYEVRQTVYRTVYVGVGRSKIFDPPPHVEPVNPRPASDQDVDSIWSQLLNVLENKYADFSLRGIYHPVLPAVPVEIPHERYYLAQGELSLEIRFTLTRGN